MLLWQFKAIIFDYLSGKDLTLIVLAVSRFFEKLKVIMVVFSI